MKITSTYASSLVETRTASCLLRDGALSFLVCLTVERRLTPTETANCVSAGNWLYTARISVSGGNLSEDLCEQVYGAHERWNNLLRDCAGRAIAAALAEATDNCPHLHASQWDAVKDLYANAKTC